MTHHNEKSSHQKVSGMKKSELSLKNEILFKKEDTFTLIEIKVKLAMDCNFVINNITTFCWNIIFVRIILSFSESSQI